MTYEQSTRARTALYHVEAGTLRAHGSIADLNDGACAAVVHYADDANGSARTVDFPPAPRQALADLLRGVADNIAPQAEGMPLTFWCELHSAELEGQPHLRHDPIIGAWELSFEHLECVHDPDGTCRPAWAVGRVAVPRAVA